jgi:hypothetical protein
MSQNESTPKHFFLEKKHWPLTFAFTKICA